ncbi:putative tetratricopeptide-like helical domain-containing protein [Lupinus albus]|uniref:Putative tetratricopeptide-like helical domain-containing protein n=1 Tax=Lupinus albus TaxID=3870 RepID=A0A6A4N5W9_LUPAL|nr:putative tetratricopeptide-like helical domain-containing protein [Lupinus albus]
MVHSQVVVRGFLMHTVFGTSLLNLYAKLRKSESSIKVFNTMPELNDVSWNAMISGFTYNGLHLQAFNCFIDMIEAGVTLSSSTFVTVSKAVGLLGDLNKCHEVHRYATRWGLDSNTFVGTALIDMYSEVWFTSCLVNTPWNAIITGYSQSSSHLEALELFKKMRQNDVKPDVYTFCCVLNSIAALKCLKSLRETHGLALKYGFDVKAISALNALADAYAKCESLEAVEKCTACGGLCLLEHGHQIHGLICKASLDTETCVESALIDMYAKCGNPMGAKNIFERISNPDVVSWTAIISTYAQHGLVEDALQLFKKMVYHRGMVEDGLKIFHQMEDTYGVVPEMQHYACVVDLLGRVGHLDEAVEFIDRMPIEPNEMIWQTLLGACRIHGNAELGKSVAQNILSTRPQYPSTYVLLSNTYIESGLYEDDLV